MYITPFPRKILLLQPLEVLNTAFKMPSFGHSTNWRDVLKSNQEYLDSIKQGKKLPIRPFGNDSIITVPFRTIFRIGRAAINRDSFLIQLRYNIKDNPQLSDILDKNFNILLMGEYGKQTSWIGRFDYEPIEEN